VTPSNLCKPGKPGSAQPVDVSKLAERAAIAAHHCTRGCSYREDCTVVVEVETRRILEVIEPIVRRLEYDRAYFESMLRAQLSDRANLSMPAPVPADGQGEAQ
jgi:hypothetical protein